MLRLMSSWLLLSLSLVTGNVIKELFNPRVIGGLSAIRGQLPYMVSLRSSGSKNHFCGGFIITERWLGSAAHCTYARSPYAFVAVVGVVTNVSQGNEHEILRTVNHPEYDSSNLRNDISLIEVAKAIKFSINIQPVRLGGYAVEEEVEAVVSGWGYTSNPGRASPSLQYTKVETITNNECKKVMTSSNSKKIFDTSICAEPAEYSSGACMGDSGGPMVSDNILIGIISWGVPCALGFPDVYTRIDPYQDWINSVLNL